MKKLLLPIILFTANQLQGQNIERENVRIDFIRMPMQKFPDSAETYFVELIPFKTPNGNNFLEPYNAENVVLNGYHRLPDANDADIRIFCEGRGSLAITDLKAESTVLTYKKDKNSPEIKYTVYTYKISYRTPQLYYSVKTGNGSRIEDDVLGGDIRTEYFGNTSYGSHYASEYQLSAAWREVKAYKVSEWEKSHFAGLFSYVENIYQKYCLHKSWVTFSVKYVKEKKTNEYQDLRDARDLYMEAVSLMRKDSVYEINKLIQPALTKRETLLKQAIEIWEKALSESDMKNKKARIDQKVTRHIFYNMSLAHLLLNDFDKAQQYLQGREDEETKDDILLKNAFAGLKSLSGFIDDQKKRKEANKWRAPMETIDVVYVYKSPEERRKEKEMEEKEKLAKDKAAADSIAAAKKKKPVVKKTAAPVKKPAVKKTVAAAPKKG